MRKSGYVIVGVFTLVLLTSGTLIAQPSTATFNLTGLSSGTQLLAGEDTSPYVGNVNGGPSMDVICDDIADNAVIPEQWTAYSTSLSSLTSSTTDPYLMFGTSGTVTGTDSVTGTWTLTQTQAYEVAALLAINILNTTGSMEADYSYALWGLFDAYGNGVVPGDVGAFGQLEGYGKTNDENYAETYLNSAIVDVQNGMVGTSALGSYLSNYNVTIYSYDSNGSAPTCGVGVSCPPPPQEFITVPEASTPILLAVDLLGFMALVGFLRKRVSQSI